MWIDEYNVSGLAFMNDDHSDHIFMYSWSWSDPSDTSCKNSMINWSFFDSDKSLFLPRDWNSACNVSVSIYIMKNNKLCTYAGLLPSFFQTSYDLDRYRDPPVVPPNPHVERHLLHHMSL